MADNVAVSSTATYTIATDEVQVGGTQGAAQVQFVKLVDGTLNGTAVIPGDTANGLDVDVTRLPALITSTAIIGKVKITDGTTDAQVSTTGGLFIGGAVAHDGTDSGNPVKVGMITIAHGTNPTAVAAADRTNLYANRAGIPFFIGGHPNIVSTEYATTLVSTDVAVVTVGAGAKVIVTQAQVVAANANTTFPQVRVGFGTANTPTTTGVILSHPGVPAGGGISRGDGSGIIGIGADNEDLRITNDVPTGGSIRVLVSYYTIES